MTHIENGYYRNGIEYIIFMNGGHYVVKEYEYDDDAGNIVFTGSYKDCLEHINAKHLEYTNEKY